jgi:hypothetical protein
MLAPTGCAPESAPNGSAARQGTCRAGSRRGQAGHTGLPGRPRVPADGFHAGAYHRLHVGDYRVVYIIEGDLIAVSRVDHVPA